MATYIYNNPPEGTYQWNLRSRINMEVGLGEEILTGKHVTGDNKMHLSFNRDLTVEEETKLDSIMTDPNANNPQLSLINNTFVIRDIAEWLPEIETALGYKIQITYRASGVHGTKPDEIIIRPCSEILGNIADKILNNPEKNALEAQILQGDWE
jgi:hypothetical protein